MAQKTTQYEIKFFTGRLLIKMDQHKCNKISICTNLSDDDGARKKASLKPIQVVVKNPFNVVVNYSTQKRKPVFCDEASHSFVLFFISCFFN